MTHALATKQKQEVAAANLVRPTETILNSDVVIPKILLMQGLSELVADGVAKMGDYVRSTTGEKLGDANATLDVIPLTFKNTWIISEKIGDKYEFRGIQERNAKNENDPWEFKENGTNWKRTKSIDLYALLPADIAAEAVEIEKFKKTGEMPDLNKTLLPVVISFRSTSYSAGKRVVTHFTQAAGMAKFGVKAYGFTLKLSCVKDKNDKGTYFVWEVKPGSKLAPESLERASEWHKIVTVHGVKVDEEAENKAADKNNGEQF